MVPLRPETESYLSEVERFAGRRFAHRDEIALLIDSATTPSLKQILDELAFRAKFLTKSSALLRRAGTSEETAKLAEEFSANLRGCAGLISRLLGGSPQKTEFPLPPERSIEDFLALLGELSWLKNFSMES